MVIDRTIVAYTVRVAGGLTWRDSRRFLLWVGFNAAVTAVAWCWTRTGIQPGPGVLQCGTPSNPNAYLYGQESMKVRYSETAGCPDQNGGPTTCTATLSAHAILGKLSASSSISIFAGDGEATAQSEQSSYSLDQVTVTSSSLPNGTPVKIKENVALTGTIHIVSFAKSGV